MDGYVGMIMELRGVGSHDIGRAIAEMAGFAEHAHVFEGDPFLVYRGDENKSVEHVFLGEPAVRVYPLGGYRFRVEIDGQINPSVFDQLEPHLRKQKIA